MRYVSNTPIFLQVYGPHIAILYASQSSQARLKSLGHFFFSPATNLSHRLGLAAASYELVASLPSVVAYFGVDRKKTWDAVSLHEERIQSILLEYLNSREDVIVYGERSADAKRRLPIVSFSIKGQSSREIVEKVEDCSNFGIRWGHVYAKRMIDDLLGLKVDGVIRVSMLHYNTGRFDYSLLQSCTCRYVYGQLKLTNYRRGNSRTGRNIYQSLSYDAGNHE